jgi:hypothetical protein
MKSLFDIIPIAKGKADSLAQALAPMLDTMEGANKLFGEKVFKDQIFEMGADRALYTDSGAAIILVADAAIDRLHKEVNLSLFDRGAETYVLGVHIAQAISSLANQYKHIGEWLQSPGATSKDREIVKALVGDPVRLDAAAEFLKRGFTSYNAFEDALISSADDIVTDGTIPARGRSGVPVITMRPAGA